MALAYLSEAYRSVENPQNQWLMEQAFFSHRKAHQMLFGCERYGAA
jgi:hypothetical protein